MLILLGAVFGLALTAISAQSESAKRFAPGQKQTEPGQAKKFAPGQKQKQPGQAKKFAPGQQTR
jgi:hypothetical protein